ncbi:MAG: RNA polymerase-binding protein DksA [Hydrotalea sp.]|nr:RNA polymerase-binding protein DksA [Hydrotalea sp.]
MVNKNLATAELDWEQIFGLFPSGMASGESAPVLPTGYAPSNDEEFMSPLMREYFRKKLIDWRQELLKSNAEVIEELQQDSDKKPDPLERASVEQIRSVDLHARNRQRKLIVKINDALIRIANKKYGYCEDTGRPIDLKRLEARPIATLSLEAQQNYENEERNYNDDL